MTTPRAFATLRRRMVKGVGGFLGTYVYEKTDTELYVSNGDWAFDVSHFATDDRELLHSELLASATLRHDQDVKTRLWEWAQQATVTVEDSGVRLRDGVVFGPESPADSGPLVVLQEAYVDLAERVADRQWLTYKIEPHLKKVAIYQGERVLGAIGVYRADLHALKRVCRFL